MKQSNLITLSQLCTLGLSTPKGQKQKGVCVWCGREVDEVFDIKVSDNFTGWSLFSHGNCMCKYCFAFFSEQSFRKRSWLATASGVSFLKKDEIESILLRPPKPPWFLYITKTGQKQGWLHCIHKVNFSSVSFVIGFEPFDFPIQTNVFEVRKLHGLLSFLREKKITKTELLTGEFKMKTYERAINGEYEEKLKEAKKQRKREIWELLCYVVK